MTFYGELKGTAMDARNKCCNEVLARAQQQLGLPREEIILRPLIASDIGYSTPKFKSTITDAAAWNSLVTTYTIADNRFVCISGVFTEEDSPTQIAHIRITRAGSVAREWNVQRVADQDDKQMHVDDPIIIDQNTTLSINSYCGLTATTGTAEEFGFIGCVAEKRGMLINP